VLLLLLTHAKADQIWFMAALLIAYVYPAAIAWVTTRAQRPVRLVLASLAFEAVAQAMFAEVVCFDPVFIIVSLTIAVINAVSTGGLMGAGIVLPCYGLTFMLVQGQLRAVPDIDVPTYIHALFGIFLLAYISIVLYQIHALTLRHAKGKRALVTQKARNDAMHQHLVSTIANPFVADETVLELIGPELSAEQSEQYLKRIRTRQQWEAIGRQTRSVVHDAKNLLVPIVGLSAVLESMMQDNEDAQECLTDLNTAVHRLNSLIGQLNPPTTADNTQTSRCVIQHVSSEVASLLEATLPDGIDLVLDYPAEDDLFYVPIDAASLHRCVMNLSTNALQAMTSPGELRLGLRPANSYERARLGVKPENHCVTLFIKDSGKGIPADILPRIFEPYFSTKEASGGTGLGLATCHALVTDVGGSLTVESKVGQGTTFFVTLPVVLQN
jgi:signal transduction histidine kinase